MNWKKTAVISALLVLTLAGFLFVLRKRISEAAEILPVEVSRADEYAGDPEEMPKTLQDWQKINPKVKYVLIFPDETVKRTIPVLPQDHPTPKTNSSEPRPDFHQTNRLHSSKQR
jgi:hypothetical protein